MKLKSHHLLEFLVSESILLLQLVLLYGERGLEFVHLFHSFPDLLQANIQMQLLLLQVTPFLIVQLDLQDKTKPIIGPFIMGTRTY